MAGPNPLHYRSLELANNVGRLRARDESLDQVQDRLVLVGDHSVAWRRDLGEFSTGAIQRVTPP